MSINSCTQALSSFQEKACLNRKIVEDFYENYSISPFHLDSLTVEHITGESIDTFCAYLITKTTDVLITKLKKHCFIIKCISPEEQSRFLIKHQTYFSDLETKTHAYVISRITQFKNGSGFAIIAHIAIQDITGITFLQDDQASKKNVSYPSSLLHSSCPSDDFEPLDSELSFENIASEAAARKYFGKEPAFYRNLIVDEIKPEFLERFLEKEAEETTCQITARVANDLYYGFLNPQVTFTEFFEKNFIFFEHVRIKVMEKVNIGVEKFRNGSPLYAFKEIDDSEIIYNYSLMKDFQELAQKPKTKTQRHLQALHIVWQIANGNENKCLELKEKNESYFDLPNYFFFLCARFNRDLDALTQFEIESVENRSAYAEFKDRRKAALEDAKMAEIEKSFATPLIRTAVQKPNYKKKRRPFKKKISPPPSIRTQPEAILRTPFPTLPPLFHSICPYKLYARVFRWFFEPVPKKLKRIKEFSDKVAGKLTYHYKNYDLNQLKEQHTYHCLKGVEHLMNLLPDLLRRYSTRYRLMHNLSLKEGRCFEAELIQDGIIVKGFIYVGFNGEDIYHAQFVPKARVDSENIVTKDLCLPLEGSQTTSENRWQTVSGYHFEIINDVLIWTIRAHEAQVLYRISPLF